MGLLLPDGIKAFILDLKHHTSLHLYNIFGAEMSAGAWQAATQWPFLTALENRFSPCFRAWEEWRLLWQDFSGPGALFLAPLWATLPLLPSICNPLDSAPLNHIQLHHYLVPTMDPFRYSSK